MPTDNRRITGPETTFSPYAFCKPPETQAVFTDDGKRKDGRSHDNIRPIFLKSGVVSQAQGSAYIEQNETKIIASVYGPRAVVKREEFSLQGQLTCEFKFATFSCRYRRQHMQDSEEKDFSVQLLEALEPAVCLHMYPKSQVNIYMTVLQDDGSALAAAVTCASVALADAGIEMYDLVTGCSARVLGESVLLDPCSTEEYRPERTVAVDNGSVTVGIMPSLCQMSAVTSKGEMKFKRLKEAIGLCTETCNKIYNLQQLCLTKSVESKVKEKT